MTLQEFKAWFEGFTENLGDKPPSAKQWVRILKRMKEIDGTVTTHTVFIDRYYREYRPYWASPYWTYTAAGIGSAGTLTGAAQGICNNATIQAAVNNAGDVSLLALNDAGRAEFNSMENAA